MLERRWGKRYRTEIRAQFGEKNLDHFGLVQDISIFGFFIVTAKVYPIGTLLNIQITSRDQEISVLQGTVQWNKERPQTSVWVIQDGGLGIQMKKFLNGQEHYEALCQKLCKEYAGEVNMSCPIQTEVPGKKSFGFIRNFFPKKD